MFYHKIMKAQNNYQVSNEVVVLPLDQSRCPSLCVAHHVFLKATADREEARRLAIFYMAVRRAGVTFRRELILVDREEERVRSDVGTPTRRKSIYTQPTTNVYIPPARSVSRREQSSRFRTTVGGDQLTRLDHSYTGPPPTPPRL
jgi:hypothetical protein